MGALPHPSALPLAHLARRRAARPAIHPIACDCRHCDPVAACRRDRGNRFARLTFIGLALGLAVAVCVDQAVAGPGVLSIFTGPQP